MAARVVYVAMHWLSADTVSEVASRASVAVSLSILACSSRLYAHAVPHTPSLLPLTHLAGCLAERQHVHLVRRHAAQDGVHPRP